MIAKKLGMPTLQWKFVQALRRVSPMMKVLDDLDEEEFVPHEKKMSEIKEKAKKAKAPDNQKALGKVASGRPSPQTMVQPVLASSTSDNGGFLFAVAVFVCGGAAFVAGIVRGVCVAA